MNPNRRTVLKGLSVGAAVATLRAPTLAAASREPDVRAEIGDGVITLAFDAALRTRVHAWGKPITGFDASECLLLKDGSTSQCRFLDRSSEDIDDARHGRGRRHRLRGRSESGLETTVTVTLYARHPGMAVLQASYLNRGRKPLDITGWRNAQHSIADGPGGFWSFSGATHEDRRDWVQPLKAGFDQTNDFGMVASDYGGGTPLVNLWSREAGLAVGHVHATPRRLRMPVRKTDRGARIAIEADFDERDARRTLAPGATFTTDTTFIAVHRGDHYAPLVAYRAFMADEGIVAPKAPASAFAPIWCAWGYERNFTTEQIIATLPKARDIGCEWAVLDDGWQTGEGDWHIDRTKFPRGEDDMRAFVAAVKAQKMRPRLWIAPLIVDPGEDLLHDHTDMLLLDRDGSVQKVSWWNAFTLCPAYQPTIDHHVALVKKIIGDWGYEGLKLDGQHLNAVAPCYNPAHKHARPEESCEKLADFWKAIHAAAHAANPEAVVELCPCGTSFAFHNLPATDQYPSSDPLSSWQVRSKGKSVKALMGAGSSYAGDHVELSDDRDDFASTFGIGAVPSTKFTWPKDTDRPIDKLPPGGFVLTPEKERVWRKWLALYREHRLAEGEYRGALYDIAFDTPETHAIAKGDALYYAFYAERFDGPVTLKGLGNRRYRLVDLYTGAELGHAEGRQHTLRVKFERFLIVHAIPTEARA